MRTPFLLSAALLFPTINTYAQGDNTAGGAETVSDFGSFNANSQLGNLIKRITDAH